jgi:acyl-CoA synthetase (AMP-forming)/AMP-acid ligase II
MLSTHPCILEVGVCAVPDSHWGERPKAFVTTKDGTNSEILGDQVIQWAKEQSHISRFMVPREVVVVKELPKTSTGKIQKNVLREWARGGGAPTE